MAAPAEPFLQQALVVKREWVDRIFWNGKMWELRGSNLRKRGRFAIAVSKTSHLAGEVTFVDSFPVGRLSEGTWLPYTNAEIDRQRFLLNPENMQKHQVDDLGSVTYKVVYASAMQSPKAYLPEICYTPVKGPMWPKLSEAVTEKLKESRCNETAERGALKRV